MSANEHSKTRSALEELAQVLADAEKARAAAQDAE